MVFSMYRIISDFFDQNYLRWLKKTKIWNAGRMVYFSPDYVVALMNLFRKKPTDMKKVFVMTHALDHGGAERVATVLASELAKQYHVVIIAARRGGRNTYPLYSGVEVMYVPGILDISGRYVKYLSRYMHVLKKSQNVYASISFLYHMNLLNVESRAEDKVICCERNNPQKTEDSFRFEEIQQIYEHADHVVFQSSIVRDLFNENVRGHCSILPNPVGVACLRKKQTNHRIVNVGRLVEQKNQELLINAFARFHEEYSEYTLSIYGAGPLKRTLTEQIRTLNLENVVRLEGQSNQIHQAISDAEIFVLSSHYEGLSNALLEAMMMGFPCISTDCEGSTDVIENGVNGLLIHRGNEDELVSALTLLAENAELRENLGRRARETSKRFRRKEVCQEWAEMIEKVEIRNKQ